MERTTTTIVAGVLIAGAIGAGTVLLPKDRLPEERVAKGSDEVVLPNEESLFAQIDPDTGEVLQVIVIDAELLNTGKWGDPANWVRTYASSTEERGRKNSAGIGYKYDEKLDAFIPPKPYESWELDEKTAQWKAPTEEPKNGKLHEWDEALKAWKELPIENEKRN